MAEVGEQISALRSDILENLDGVASTAGRWSNTLLNRRINLAQDRLHAILAKAGEDDWLTYMVGVIVPGATYPEIQSIPLPTHYTSEGTPSWWAYPVSLQYATIQSPNANYAVVKAPGFMKLRAVHIAENYTAAGAESAYQAVLEWNGKLRPLTRAGYSELLRDTTAREWSYQDPPRYRLLGQNVLTFDRRGGNNACFVISYTANITTIGETDYFALQPLWRQFLIAHVTADMLRRDRDGLSAEFRAEAMSIAQEILDGAQDRDEHEPVRINETWGDDMLGTRDLRDLVTFRRR